MNKIRIAITGIGIASPIGNDFKSVQDALRSKKSGVRAMPEWDEIEGLKPRVSALCDNLDWQKLIPRKFRRSMGKVAMFAAYATGEAIRDAGLDDELVKSGRVGIAVGSTTGSTAATHDYYANILGPGFRQNKSTGFLQVMSHTAAANTALMYGITGRVWAPNSACTSGAQAIGLGVDTLRAGSQDVMLCGGADEAHHTSAGVFDLVSAASSDFNDEPTRTPRPFDKNRDGLVIGEGAGILALERWDDAKARGAKIYGEILDFATSCDGGHITQPSAAGMSSCMRLALQESQVEPSQIDYVNAHATG
ncbi:hypothetical protein KAI87_11370, partial [Myxococcota bacterium]|nr:hypothetical protein [Myxococcota bacterium]